jgi:hypothetical protein
MGSIQLKQKMRFLGETNRANGLNSISIPGTEKKVVNELTDDDKRNLAIVGKIFLYFIEFKKNF